MSIGVAALFLACGSRTDVDDFFSSANASGADSAVDGEWRSNDASSRGDGAVRDASRFDARSTIDGSRSDAGDSLWPLVWGGVESEVATAVAVGSDGTVVIAGVFQNTVDFDPGSGVDEHTAVGGADGFVMKVSADGAFEWVRTWGGGSSWANYPQAIAIASDGSIFATGSFGATVDFDPGPDVDSRTSAGDSDVFVMKLDARGNYGWTRTWGGPGMEYAWGGDVAPDGSVYVGGGFEDTVDFDPGAPVDAHTSNGQVDVFVTKLDDAGNFVWARTWGGPGIEYNVGKLAVDESGSVAVAGSFEQTVDFDPGPGVDNRTSVTDDLFVLKLLADGDQDWARTLDGSGATAELASGVAVAHDGSFIVAGNYSGTVDFDPTGGVDTHRAGTDFDAFVLRLASNGDYVWTRTFGGSTSSAGSSAQTVSTDSANHVVVGGGYYGTIDFDPGVGVVTRGNAGPPGTSDMFALALADDGTFVSAKTWGGAGADWIFGVCGRAGASSIVVGYFQGTVDLSSTSLADPHTSNGPEDAFALKWTP